MTISDQTLSNLINSTNSIAEHMSKQTDAYIWVSLASMLAGFAIYFIFLYQPIRTKIEFLLFTRSALKKIAKINHRNVIVMSHRSAGLFGSMITMEDAIKFEKLVRKYKSHGIDFIINTFGGELFASMRIALLVQGHGDIRVFVPKYSWSGGSLISIAAKEIHMGKYATLSPVDAQLGNLIKSFSAKYWKKIVKDKGNKASDETIAFAELSQQILEEQKDFLNDILKTNPNVDKEKFMLQFLTGDMTHGKQIKPEILSSLGFNIKEITSDLYDKVIEDSKREGVFGVEFKDKK